MLQLHGYGLSILSGVVLTLKVAFCSLFFAVVLGFIAAFGKLSKNGVFRRIATSYTTCIRGIPDLVLMLLIFYGGQMFINAAMNQIGYSEYVDINPFVAGVSTLGFIYGAYMTETFRGAILAVPPGQLEAGYACGMRKQLVFVRILFPQMMRHALPGFGNNWLVLLKGTALVSVIGLDDMLRKAGLAAGATREPFAFYAYVSLIYLSLTLLSIRLLKWMEKRYSSGFHKA
ncbi:MAG: ABC transporter permease [Chitinivibrionales bacterium]|nr:ABC transporter permease [Chitinivibrionales bacterium]